MWNFQGEKENLDRSCSCVFDDRNVRHGKEQSNHSDTSDINDIQLTIKAERMTDSCESRVLIAQNLKNYTKSR